MIGADFEPQDPAFDSKVRTSFARQAAMASLGIEIGDLGPGWIELQFRPPPGFTQQDGYVHAGVVAAALDSACGYAAYSLTPPGTDVLTSEYKINLLRPVGGDSFLARGFVIKPGRTLTICQGELRSEPNGPLLAVMTGTIILRPQADERATGES